MPQTATEERTQRRPLRLWPGVIIAVLVVLAKFVVPLFEPEAAIIGMMGGLVGALAIVVWWVFFSRALWSERLGAVALMILAVFATSFFIDESIATGAMGMLFYVLAIPLLSLAFVAWAVAAGRLPDGPRRASMIATILLASGGWTLVRTGGFTSYGDNDFSWRWGKTPEDRLLAQAGAEPAALPDVPAAAATEASWPGFRGSNRDSIIRGVRIATDWTASPPIELWRQPVGPGWSSFAVRGECLYTQEQRGDDEVVSCYRMTTGEPVWRHGDAARFWESNAGAGPRGTPTLHADRVYSLGATGILNALDAGDGAVVWSRNAASDTNTPVPDWGFASSPLVIDDVVIVATAGTLVAYDRVTGDRRWSGPTGGKGYSSPHLLTIGGVAQVLLMSDKGEISVAPADGTVLWEHAWPGFGIVQPALLADGDILISTGDRGGVRRIAVVKGPGGWTIEERWTSTRLKPYFNDFVVHSGHAYGFDGGILACVDVANGDRTWKGGRYGRGQLVLLADQDLLLVLSEQGELALVAATPGEFKEIAKIPAIEGKTWNHPVLVGDLLLVRNDQEMAAFRLSRTGG
jgi:outer membrane protein assembly factor BamB